MTRFFVLVGLMGAWGCGDDEPARELSSAVGDPDSGTTSADAGMRPDPDCGGTVELVGATSQAPAATWLAWSDELRACLDDHDIPTVHSWDDLSFWRAEAIAVDGGGADGALVCARAAVVVQEDEPNEGTLRQVLALAYVAKEDKQRAIDACGQPTGPQCGNSIDLDDVHPIEPPPEASAWYTETAACLEELEIAPRYEFEDLTFWSSSSIEVGTVAVCSDGALLFRDEAPSERIIRYAMVTANTEPDDQNKATMTCVDALIAP